MNRIKTLRLENNLSQRDLAAKIGCSQKSVDCWEKDLSEPTAGFICALADCFACSADYLLAREDDFGVVRIEGGLTQDERRMLDLYDALPESHRKELLNYGKYLSAKKD